MKCKISFLVFVSFLVAVPVWSQKENILVATIGDTPISLSEFEYAYNKEATRSNTENRQTPEQFLESYINFKINTVEAKNKGVDKTSAFKKEYKQSVDQMIDTYTKDSIFNNDWLKTEYRRLGENIQVQNIFIPFSKTGYIYSADTISAYNEAFNLRKMIKNDGTNFEQAVQQYVSANPSGTNSIMLGQKYWITSMMTDDNFENKVYQLAVNNVSEPIRISNGYYIAKVLNRQPDKGTIRVSDIYLKYPQDATQNQKDSVNNLASSIYTKLLSGADFNELCKQYTYNFDPKIKGDLGFFSVRRPMNPTFQSAIENLSVGDYAKPFLFADGLHLVKVTDIQNIGSFDEMKEDIIDRLSAKDLVNRFYVHENEAAKKRIPYTIDESAYRDLLDIANRNNVCEMNSLNVNSLSAAKTLIVVGDKKYTIADFLAFFKNNKKDICSIYQLSSDVLYYGVNSYLFGLLTKENQELLLKNDPQLINVANEYYDGILYFNIMSEELWDKAQKDDKGLNSFYEVNKNQYKWSTPRYEGYLIFAKNKNIKKEAESIIKKNSENNNLASVLKENLNTKDNINVIVEKGFWSKGENPYIDALLYGVSTTKTFVGYPVFFFEGKKIEQPRSVNDVRGLVIDDYQAVLYKERIAKLKEKYEIVINKDVLDSISTK